MKSRQGLCNLYARKSKPLALTRTPYLEWAEVVRSTTAEAHNTDLYCLYCFFARELATNIRVSSEQCNPTV